VAAGRLRPAYVFEDAVVLRLEDGALLADHELRAADPDLESFRNVNEPADYAAARARPAPEVTVACVGVLASLTGRELHQVRAATVGSAALAVALTLDRHVLVTVNGDQTGRDPDLPLLAGDTVAFTSADAAG
jgi:molybdopterin-guanine dinucleotide biosynthesis protein A